MKLPDVRRFALSLAEVTEEPHHELTSFRVRGKIFVTSPPPGETIHVFVDEATREQAIAMAPEFIEKLLWGGKVRGIRIHLATAKPAVVKALVQSAFEYRRPAPRKAWPEGW